MDTAVSISKYEGESLMGVLEIVLLVVGIILVILGFMIPQEKSVRARRPKNWRRKKLLPWYRRRWRKSGAM